MNATVVPKKAPTAQTFIRQSSGNLLEWYDYGLYGIFAVQISQTFFSSAGPFIGLVLTFLTFAMGFVIRPLGGVIFGRIGDKHGKGFTINLTVWCIALPTLIIGLMPGYNVLGIWAPIILVLLRMFQGLSAGGQLSGLIALAADSNAKNKPFLVSIVWSISIAGGLVAAFVGFLSVEIIGHLNTHFQVTNTFLLSLEWRLPFILSFCFFLGYLWLVPKHSRQKEAPSAHANFKFFEIFQKQPKELIYLLLLNAGIQTFIYMILVYFITYFQNNWHFSTSTALLWANAIMILAVILYPLFGLLVPKYHYRVKQAQFFTLLMLPCIFLFMLFSQNMLLGIIGLIGFVVFQAAICSFVGSLFGELFDHRYRMTACSLAYNIGVIFAGFSPMLAELFNGLSPTYGLSGFLVLIIAFVWVILGRLRTSKHYQALLERQAREKQAAVATPGMILEE
ncbi:MFS transporter [Facilibium subflavum]|uniref:MFS transporter n=1 Tax=Facilibium subflavum TaxID=2219058 RepID=UPI0013C2DB5F|nr:MFS transporter [Facilibium subflavum]